MIVTFSSKILLSYIVVVLNHISQINKTLRQIILFSHKMRVYNLRFAFLREGDLGII